MSFSTPRARSRSGSVASSDSRRDSGIDMKSDDTVTQPSKKLYERLAALGSDPNDPNAVADVTILAFGAFERYYVCWKNHAGEFRQDSYGLPEPLHDWLFPADGSSRHFPSLSVVLGRGDEFFASDKDGKIDSKDLEKHEHKKTDSVTDITTQLASQNLDGSPDPNNEPQDASRARSSTVSDPRSTSIRPRFQAGIRRARTLSLVRPSTDTTDPNGGSAKMSPVLESPRRRQLASQPMSPDVQRQRMSRPRSIVYNVSGGHDDHSAAMRFPQPAPETACPNCGLENIKPKKPTYVDSGCQADLPPPPAPNNGYSEYPPRGSWYGAAPHEGQAVPPIFGTAPVVMGALGSYFRTGGYQLGDALRSSYQPDVIYEEEPVYYEDEYAYEYEEGVQDPSFDNGLVR